MTSAETSNGREMTQKERMLAGRYYFAVSDTEVMAEQAKGAELCAQFNAARSREERLEVARRLFGSIDESGPPFIEPPFTCGFGKHISLGKGTYINFNCCFLDNNRISIGEDTLIGPNVQLYTPGHPIDANVRDGLRGPEFASPIVIGRNCWIGGSAIILGGVTVGDCSVIAAGAVVTKDVEPWSMVGGNPARLIRKIQPGDKTSKEVP